MVPVSGFPTALLRLNMVEDSRGRVGSAGPPTGTWQHRPARGASSGVAEARAALYTVVGHIGAEDVSTYGRLNLRIANAANPAAVKLHETKAPARPHLRCPGQHRPVARVPRLVERALPTGASPDLYILDEQVHRRCNRR